MLTTGFKYWIKLLINPSFTLKKDIDSLKVNYWMTGMITLTSTLIIPDISKAEFNALKFRLKALVSQLRKGFSDSKCRKIF